ncbi:uncharacterized protein UV8b_00984 [Ustilaginoidea virens]|uniref:Uncharacterized protein n=1 Tax=Ustilaginoidea virens TaxID=1159556 RepID=A0A8E5MDY1_USTVR|nr:uncharacterized protein UV8b_00984 [Ustilaginoidea virens]QUC16743.1 hypothetical protein UV8b_00984 [Ustilaginoidea virens]
MSSCPDVTSGQELNSLSCGSSLRYCILSALTVASTQGFSTLHSRPVSVIRPPRILSPLGKGGRENPMLCLDRWVVRIRVPGVREQISASGCVSGAAWERVQVGDGTGNVRRRRSRSSRSRRRSRSRRSSCCQRRGDMVSFQKLPEKGSKASKRLSDEGESKSFVLIDGFVGDVMVCKTAFSGPFSRLLLILFVPSPFLEECVW